MNTYIRVLAHESFGAYGTKPYVRRFALCANPACNEWAVVGGFDTPTIAVRPETFVCSAVCEEAYHTIGTMEFREAAE